MIFPGSDKRQHGQKEVGGWPNLFCCELCETASHLFFQCPVTKVVWVWWECALGLMMYQPMRQYWTWIAKWLPNGEVYTFGWRRSAGQSGKQKIELVLRKSWTNIQLIICQSNELQSKLLEGVKVMMNVACCISANQHHLWWLCPWWNMNITRRSIEGKKRPNLACTPYLASRLESGLGVSPRLVPFQFFFLFLYANLQYFHSGQWKWGRSSHQAKQNSFTTLFHF